MENYDPALAARVWQRVRGEPEAQPQGIQIQLLMEEEWEDAAIYLYLSRRYQGRVSGVLHRMHQQARDHISCLKGICALTAQCQPVFPPQRPPRETLDIVLRRCYGRTLQRLAQYLAYEQDPQYGHIFSRLAREEKEHSQYLLQLLGRFGQRK